MVVPYFENIRQQIIEVINEATDEIFVAVYWFTNKQLFWLLCEKLKEGKKVSLIVHNDYINNREAGLNFQSFIDLGGQFYFSDAENPMHNKFCVVDNKTLINGSYNWTYYAEDRNSENILLIKDEYEAISSFRKEFIKLTELLKRVDKVQYLTAYELEEFNGLSSREYLANDIIYEAKVTNRPDIIQTAFKISPNNIRVQETAVKLELTKKKKLESCIGVGLLGNKYLIGVEKETILPVSISKILKTTEDNQTSCFCPLYYGENDVANMNKKMPNKSKNGREGGVVIHEIPPKPVREAKMKMIFTIDVYGLLRVKFYSLDNGNNDEYEFDINGLLVDVND